MKSRFSRLVWVGFCAVMVMACESAPGDPDTPGAVVLIDNEAWGVVSAADDGFVTPTAVAEDCVNGDGFLGELFGTDLVLSVDTGKCAALTVEQPLLESVPAGVFVTGRLWHFALSAENPALGWVAISVDEDLVWAEQFPIPAESGLLLIKWRAARQYEAGAPIRFHIQNHGANSWHLIDLVRSL